MIDDDYAEAHESMREAHRLAETFINGNRNDVVDVFAAMTPVKAAFVAVGVMYFFQLWNQHHEFGMLGAMLRARMDLEVDGAT